MSTKFPKTLAAVQAFEEHQWSDQWAIGDALIEECGSPGKNGVRDGSGQKLLEASIDLKANGLIYAPNTLRKFREISSLYEPARRRAGVSWTVHEAVRDADMLDRVIEGIPKDDLTAEAAVAMVQKIYEDNYRNAEAERVAIYEAAKKEEEQAAAREKEAAEEAKNAATEEAKRIAEKKRAEANSAKKDAQVKKRRNQKLPPRREVDKTAPIPAANKIPGIALSMALCLKASEATKAGNEALEILELRGGELDEISVDAIIEEGLQAHQKWLDVVNMLRKSHGNRRGHLSVVGENDD